MKGLSSPFRSVYNTLLSGVYNLLFWSIESVYPPFKWFFLSKAGLFFCVCVPI